VAQDGTKSRLEGRGVRRRYSSLRRPLKSSLTLFQDVQEGASGGHVDRVRTKVPQMNFKIHSLHPALTGGEKERRIARYKREKERP